MLSLLLSSRFLCAGGATELRNGWDHVHQCGVCSHTIRIDRIDLRVIAIGVITCPNCEASGPINVRIMELIRPSAMFTGCFRAFTNPSRSESDWKLAFA
jgi:hypothetical protein